MHLTRSENEEEICEVVCLAGQDLKDLCLVEYGPFIRKIDLSFNVLVSLRGLHNCSDTLEELILDNNRLKRVDFKAGFRKLHTLSLNNNRITNLEILLQELSSGVKNLRHVSLLGNPVCPDRLTCDTVEEKDYQIYRCHILFHLKNVRFLDHRPVPLSELIESRELIYDNVKIVQSCTPLAGGSGSHISILTRRPSSSSVSFSPRSSDDRPISTSNGETRRRHSSNVECSNNNTHSCANCNTVYPHVSIPSGIERGHMLRPDQPIGRGRTGKRRFRYVGKNSEGNRFIQDRDL